METEIVKITAENKKEVLNKAAAIIKNGGLVVFPTETVYGLGANIYNEQALKNIFLAKGRPSDNPLIIHISDKEQLKDLVKSISLVQQKLIDSFWPGPLTIIFEKKENISNILSGGLSTIAVRMPSNIIARELINLSLVPIAAPSANTSGRPSGTLKEHIYEDLFNKVDMIIDSGESEIGVESTVVKVSDDSILILRPGKVTKEMLEEVVLPIPVSFAKEKEDLQSSPGTKYKHYAPKAKLEILLKENILDRAEVLNNDGLKIGIITTSQNKNLFKKYEPNLFILGDENNLEEISKNLYSALRFFDLQNVDTILCQSFSKEGLGMAIMDRLERASAKV